jgi:hypothetical protein
VGRPLAAGAAFLAAAGSGVLSALVTADSSLGLWIALGVLIATGAVLQGLVTAAERRTRPHVLASGPGAVAVGGSAGEVGTRVKGGFGSPTRADAADINASGPGAVSIGGDATGPVTTDVTNAKDDKQP